MSNPQQLPAPPAQNPSPLLITPITLAETIPEGLPNPKFQLGQQVLWAQVPTHGFGTIIGIIFAHSISVCATGYHYAIALDPASPSRVDCAADWGFEADLELIATHAHLLPNLASVSQSSRATQPS